MTVMSDKWRARNKTVPGPIHQTANHSLNLVDPIIEGIRKTLNSVGFLQFQALRQTHAFVILVPIFCDAILLNIAMQTIATPHTKPYLTVGHNKYLCCSNNFSDLTSWNSIIQQ